MTPFIPQSEPSLSWGILKIWILNRNFPDSSDYWDGNWLNVVAECSDLGASVIITGPIIHLREIEAFRTQLIDLDKTLKGTAELPTLEPNLQLKLTCDKLGHIAAECHITPDHMSQSHSFEFVIDQTFLKSLIHQCNRILDVYPIRNPEQK